MSTPSHPAGPAGGADAGLDPERLALLVQTCPTVAGLHGGRFGEVASYLPGRRVRGIRVTETGVEIHVVGRYPTRTTEIAAQVRAAVMLDTGSLPVHVTIEDLALPGEPDPGAAIEHDPARRTPATETTGPGSASPSPLGGVPAFPPPESTTLGETPDSDTAAAHPPVLGLDHTPKASR